MRPTIPMVLMTSALLALAAGGAAQGAAPEPEVREEKDKIVLQNDEITVWFHGKKPMLKVFPTADADNASAAFTFKFHRALEYRDLDANGLPSNGEILSSLNLEKASAWRVNTSEANGTVVLNLSLEAPVKAAEGVVPEGLELPGDRTARIALVFTLSGSALSVDAGDVNLTVPASAVKYDFVVERWPTVAGAEGRLALEAHVGGELEAQDVLGVGGAAVDANGTSVGVLAWTDTATGVTTEGEAIDVPVRTETEALAASEAQASADAENASATAMTRLVHTFDAANLASLVYDPVIGVASAGALDPTQVDDAVREGLNDVPGVGIALAAAAVGATALVARRR